MEPPTIISKFTHILILEFHFNKTHNIYTNNEYCIRFLQFLLEKTPQPVLDFIRDFFHRWFGNTRQIGDKGASLNNKQTAIKYSIQITIYFFFPLVVSYTFEKL